MFSNSSQQTNWKKLNGKNDDDRFLDQNKLQIPGIKGKTTFFHLACLMWVTSVGFTVFEERK